MTVSLPPESSSDLTTWLVSISTVAALASVSMAFLLAWALASVAFISSCDSRQRTSSWRACCHWLASTAPGNCVSSCAIVASASAQLFWRRLISSRSKSAVSAFGSSLSAAIFNQDSAWGRLPTLTKSWPMAAALSGAGLALSGSTPFKNASRAGCTWLAACLAWPSRVQSSGVMASGARSASFSRRWLAGCFAASRLW